MFFSNRIGRLLHAYHSLPRCAKTVEVILLHTHQLKAMRICSAILANSEQEELFAKLPRVRLVPVSESVSRVTRQNNLTEQ